MTEIAVTIRLKYDIRMGEVNLNEIVYVLQQQQSALMRELLTAIIRRYDDDAAELLCGCHTSRARKGLGRHGIIDGNNRRYTCRGRCARKRGYRSELRHIMTVFGQIVIPLRIVECRSCGTRYSPLLDGLGIEPFRRKESNFEHAVIESVIDTNYRRLIDGRSIDISLGGIHNIVAGSDVPRGTDEPIEVDKLCGIMADGTGLKQYKGSTGELRAVIGIDKAGAIVPLGTFVNTSWQHIEKSIRGRLTGGTERQQQKIPFVYDGEPGLDGFLAGVAETQRCTWHASRGAYHALWEDGLKKKQSEPYQLQIKELVGIELPEGNFELLKARDKNAIKDKLSESKQTLDGLIGTFRERGYEKAVAYLENMVRQVFTNVHQWLETGVIAPKTTSRLERMFRELGRRLKRIAWGWSDTVATNLAKMIVVRQYQRDRWEAFWKKKLCIKGNFSINLMSIEIRPCHNL